MRNLLQFKWFCYNLHTDVIIQALCLTAKQFKTAFKERDFSKYDWKSLRDNSPKGELKNLCDTLLQFIKNHTESHSFLSHSDLYELLNNLFNAYLSWDECKIDLYQLLNYVNTKYIEHNNNTDNDDDEDFDIDIDTKNKSMFLHFDINDTCI